MEIKHEHVLAIVLAVMVFVVALQTVQLLGLKSSIAGDTLTSSAGGAGETYEQMMERMHGTSGSSAPAAASSSAPRQVGGC
jgi:hypothetical protein